MSTPENNAYIPLLREDFQPGVPPYFIEKPEIPSGSAYYFNTGSGLRYEVLFARKRDNYLRNIINFSVLSEEFDDEYSETNRGEVYRVISTVAEIIRLYHNQHNYVTSYEFSGEFKEENDSGKASKRSLLYFNKGLKILHPAWDIELCGNKVVVSRKIHRYE
jgi:hypothetical protein